MLTETIVKRLLLQKKGTTIRKLFVQWNLRGRVHKIPLMLFYSVGVRKNEKNYGMGSDYLRVLFWPKETGAVDVTCSTKFQ
jgi:hypothetical protein